MGTERIAPGIPHIPEPEDKRDDDENSIQREPSGHQHQHSQDCHPGCEISEIKGRRKQHLPSGSMVNSPARRKITTPKGYIVEQKGHRPPEDRVAHTREPHHARERRRRNAMATPTTAFMIVIVIRYAEISSLSICCDIYDDLALAAGSAAVSRRDGAGRCHLTRAEKKKQHPPPPPGRKGRWQSCASR